MEMRAIPPPPDMRNNATDELKQYGIRYFLVARDDFGSADFFTRQKEWNIEVVGEAQGSRLYRVL